MFEKRWNLAPPEEENRRLVAPMSTRQKLRMTIVQESVHYIDRTCADAWDRQMDEDAASGKLDHFFAEMEKENAGRPNVPLADFLAQSMFPRAL